MKTPALALGLLLALAALAPACGEESDCERALALQLAAVRDWCTPNRALCRTCDCWLREQIVGADGACEEPPACEDDPATPEDECHPAEEETCGVNQRYEAQLCLKSERLCRLSAVEVAEEVCALEWLLQPCVSTSDCHFGLTCQELTEDWFCLEPL